MQNTGNITGFINNPYAFIDLNYGGITSLIDFKDKTPEYNKQIQRLADTALSFLNFYQPIARCFFVATHVMESFWEGIKFKHITDKIPKQQLTSLSDDNKRILNAIRLKSVGLAISAVTSIFSYRIGLVVSLSTDTLYNALQLRSVIFKKNKKDEDYKWATDLAKDIIKLAAVVVQSPKMLVISLIAHMAFVSYETYQEAKKNPMPLMSLTQKVDLAVQLLVLGIYGYQFKQQVQLAKLI